MTDGPSLMPFTIIASGFPAVWCAWTFFLWWGGVGRWKKNSGGLAEKEVVRREAK